MWPLTVLTVRSLTLQIRLGSEATQHRQDMETLVQSMSGQTNQRLEEFRNGVGREVSEVLRGTPQVDTPDTVTNGRVILVRLWETVDALRQKAIPIRFESRGKP